MDELNKQQNLVLKAGVVIAAIMVLFPPWSSVERIGGLSNGTGAVELQVTKGIGYGFLFAPPDGPISNSIVNSSVTVAFGRLLLQLFAAAGLTAGGIFMFNGAGQASKVGDDQ